MRPEKGFYVWRVLTGEIQLFEELSILVIPPLAHVHAEGPVQARNIWWSFPHEVFRLYAGQLLPLLLLGL